MTPKNGSLGRLLCFSDGFLSGRPMLVSGRVFVHVMFEKYGVYVFMSSLYAIENH